MKAYVVVTGSAFALLTLVHVWRFIAERSVVTDPFFVVVTMLSASLAIWAGRLAGSALRP